MVKAKKYLGQHFLKDDAIAGDIVSSLTFHRNYPVLLEIGPGTGVLTAHLINKDKEIVAIDLDGESVAYLSRRFSATNLKIIHGDYLKSASSIIREGCYGIIGNFPYNISSQIFFRVLSEKNRVMEVVCMLQKEVAERIASPPGSRVYGILSVLLQAFYDIEYLFTVEPHFFLPPPKVKSGVIRLVRNDIKQLDCNEEMFVKIVKAGFQKRRKTLRNALKELNLPDSLYAAEIMNKRAEQLEVQEFIELTKLAESGGKGH